MEEELFVELFERNNFALGLSSISRTFFEKKNFFSEKTVAICDKFNLFNIFPRV